eukprot:3405522-Prymnesium_polylepis.1
MDTPHGVSAASGRCGLRTVCAFSIADAVSGAMSMAAWRSSTLHDETVGNTRHVEAPDGARRTY